MAIIAQEEEIKYVTVDGKKVLKYRPRVEITLKHTESGKEYASEEEAKADVSSPDTDTKAEHIRRDVNVTVEEINIGADFNIKD